MEISDDLVDRFFKGQGNSEEAEAVLAYLESNPEVLERHLSKREWDQVEATSAKIPELQSERMLKHIRLAISKKPARKFTIKYIAIAASLLIIAGAFFFILNLQRPHSEHQTASASAGLKFIRNQSKNVKRFVLDDGSAVDLDSGAEISLPQHFPNDRSGLRLSGKAKFFISKDKSRPFSVLAANTTTTVLGTIFIIDARPGIQATNISLLAGKVMVEVPEKTTGRIAQHYLRPRQQLIHSRDSGTTVIDASVDKRRKVKSHRDEAVSSKPDHGVPAFSFHRVQVATVFQTLEQSHRVKIVFPAKGLKNNYFTGNFQPDDSLERMLKVVAELNNMELKKTAAGYQLQNGKNKFHQ